MRELAFVVPSMLLGWFGHYVITGNLRETIAGLVVIGYLVIVGFSVDTFLRQPKPMRNSEGQWVTREGKELTLQGVLLWYHGLFVFVGLIAMVLLSGAGAFFKVLMEG